MSTSYLFQQRTWQYLCDFGCWDYGYATEIEASEAENGHDCCFQEVPQ